MDKDDLAELVRRLNGMFYGGVSDQDRKIVDEAVRLGIVRREYVGVGGMLGLSKIVVTLPERAGDTRDPE